MSERSWYVIQCKARESFRATEHLQNQGFEVFHPFIQVEKIRQGKLTLMDEPLFPYYLFIHLSDVTDNWRPIRSTRGVLKLLTFGNQPLQVDEQLIDQLRQRVQPEPEHLLKAGDPLLIEEGPFKGLKAIFECHKGEERVILLLDLLQKQQRVELPLSVVRPA
ncbi:transcription/translation regulatory transformer protein RfaH [Marinospirillum alkaliphilum]|uniref:Transcription antitermination protein RfaH n=1 Tax=Marinospirillum alkaliphilum DSM 21637 TaxID=1122209 RepID=A0A1K1YMH9_9GAMM|nr:transcription/translation regulatory transformer protein RfaH [Marinospirillum alkaliphilum]SFX62556.1 transcriptional antiterminator RfaH [Marinospirillum alkaliphilum DSM 21637]